MNKPISLGLSLLSGTVVLLSPIDGLAHLSQDQLHIGVSAFAPRNHFRHIDTIAHIRVTPEMHYISMDGQDGLIIAPYRFEREVRGELLTYRDYFIVQRASALSGLQAQFTHSDTEGVVAREFTGNSPLANSSLTLLWPEFPRTVRPTGMNKELPLTIPERGLHVDQWIETFPLEPGDYLVAGKLTSGSRLEFGEPPITATDAPADALAVHWIVPVDSDFQFDEFTVQGSPDSWFYQLLATNCIRRLGMINSQIRLDTSFVAWEARAPMGQMFARLADAQADAVAKALLYGRAYQLGNFFALVPYVESLSESSVLTPENYAYEVEGEGKVSIWKQPWGLDQYKLHLTQSQRENHLMPDEVIDRAFRLALETDDPQVKAALFFQIPYFPIWATNQQILQLLQSVDPEWTTQYDLGSPTLNAQTFAARASNRLRNLVSTPYGLSSFDMREYSDLIRAGATGEELFERWTNTLSNLEVPFAVATHPFNKAFSESLMMDLFEARSRFENLEILVVQVMSEPERLRYREIFSVLASGGTSYLQMERVLVHSPDNSKLESPEADIESEPLSLLFMPQTFYPFGATAIAPLEIGKWYVVLGTRATTEEHIRLDIQEHRTTAWLDPHALPGEFSVSAIFPTKRQGVPGLALGRELSGLELQLAQVAALLDPTDIASVLHATRLLSRVRSVLGYPAQNLEPIGDLLRQQAAHSCDYGRLRLIMTATLYGHPVGMTEFLDLLEPLTGYVRSDRRIEGEQPELLFNPTELGLWSHPLARMLLLPPSTRTALEHERLRRIQASGDLPEFLLSSSSGRSITASRSMKPFDQVEN